MFLCTFWNWEGSFSRTGALGVVATNSHRFSHIHTAALFYVILSIVDLEFFFFTHSPLSRILWRFPPPLAPVHRCHCSSSSWFLSGFLSGFLYGRLCVRIFFFDFSSFLSPSRWFTVLLRLSTHTITLQNKAIGETEPMKRRRRASPRHIYNVHALSSLSFLLRQVREIGLRRKGRRLSLVAGGCHVIPGSRFHSWSEKTTRSIFPVCRLPSVGLSCRRVEGFYFSFWDFVFL